MDSGVLFGIVKSVNPNEKSGLIIENKTKKEFIFNSTTFKSGIAEGALVFFTKDPDFKTVNVVETLHLI